MRAARATRGSPPASSEGRTSEPITQSRYSEARRTRGGQRVLPAQRSARRMRKPDADRYSGDGGKGMGACRQGKVGSFVLESPFSNATHHRLRPAISASRSLRAPLASSTRIDRNVTRSSSVEAATSCQTRIEYEPRSGPSAAGVTNSQPSRPELAGSLPYRVTRAGSSCTGTTSWPLGVMCMPTTELTPPKITANTSSTSVSSLSGKRGAENVKLAFRPSKSRPIRVASLSATFSPATSMLRSHHTTARPDISVAQTCPMRSSNTDVRQND
jgi:hypothetical protein